MWSHTIRWGQRGDRGGQRLYDRPRAAPITSNTTLEWDSGGEIAKWHNTIPSHNTPLGGVVQCALLHHWRHWRYNVLTSDMVCTAPGTQYTIGGDRVVVQCVNITHHTIYTTITQYSITPHSHTSLLPHIHTALTTAPHTWTWLSLTYGFQYNMIKSLLLRFRSNRRLKSPAIIF